MKKSNSFIHQKNPLIKIKGYYPNIKLPIMTNPNKTNNDKKEKKFSNKKNLMLTISPEYANKLYKNSKIIEYISTHQTDNFQPDAIKRNHSYSSFHNKKEITLQHNYSSIIEPINNINQTSNNNKIIIDSNARMHLLKKREFARTFVAKTKEIYKTKISINLKKERYLQMKEKKRNEIDSKKEQIESMNNANSLLNEFVNVKVNELVKQLNYLVKVESMKLEKQRNVMYQRKKELLLLENKISEKECELSHLERWFIFQLEVKYEKRYNEIIEKNLVAQEQINKYKSKLIFESAEDFLSQFKTYQMDNINLLKKYNRIAREIIELNNQKNTLQMEAEKPSNTLNQEVKKNKMLLVELKQKNGELYLWKQKKIEVYKKKSKNWLVNKNLTLSSKICDLYFILVDNYQSNSKYNRVNFFYNYENEVITILEFIEKVINKIIFEINNFDKGKNNILMINAIKELERKKIIQKSEIQRLEEEQKFNNLQKRIENNKNKIYFLPYKKVDIYYFNNAKKIIKDKNKLGNCFNDKSKIQFQSK